MLERVSRFISEHQLIKQTDRVLVGFSGGADSTCLLHILKSLGIDCVAAHLHHGQREEAEEEVEACKSFADTLGIPFISGEADVPAMSSELGIGLEEAGREARYDFFTRAARQVQCSVTATGHTSSDQLETVLFNMLRGTGLKGLRGIPIARQQIVRPILCLTREETVAYCRANNFPFLTDPANKDLDFSRARLRHKVVPELSAINPNVERAVQRMSEILTQEDGFLDGMAAAALEQAEVVPNPDLAFLTSHMEIQLDASTMTTLPPVLFRRSMRLATQALGGKLDWKQCVSLLKGIKQDEAGSITSCEGAVDIRWTQKYLTLTLSQEVAPFRSTFDLGELETDELGWKLSAETKQGTGAPPVRRSLQVELSVKHLKRPLTVRSIEPGDRMTPLGFNSTRKVSDLIAEAKVARSARSRLPILCDLLGPIWVPGVCLDNRFSRRGPPEGVIVVRFGAHGAF